MFKKLLVPLDGSELAEEAIGRAAGIARASGATIDLLLVHQPYLLRGPGDPNWTERPIAREDGYLGAIAGELASGARVTATHTIMYGDPVEAICARAMDCDVDLIVMTSHGRTGWSRAWIGSIADGVTRGSATPVLMLRPVLVKKDRRDAKLFHKLLIPVDGSDVANEVLDSAINLAKCSNASVSLLRIVEPVMLIGTDASAAFTYLPMMIDDPATEGMVALANRDLDAAGAILARNGITEVEKVVVVSPRIALAIGEFARSRGFDGIAMSTHGRGMSRLLVGSVADKVRRSVDVPVLMYRPRGAGVAKVPLTSAAIAAQLPALAGVREMNAVVAPRRDQTAAAPAVSLVDRAASSGSRGG